MVSRNAIALLLIQARQCRERERERRERQRKDRKKRREKQKREKQSKGKRKDWRKICTFLRVPIDSWEVILSWGYPS